ncbi:hypothetical protein E3G52_000336 [Mycobacteroides abscessus]|uniref:hypothetical protein n=1 Tax=Mycobacteroides abscessus TaxID=36809 RepID=UPI001878429B|nr:hypothetical protein [Mycobacteroides abscessus]MBE5453472.1 hypothetical protein [Mycobacteroides abscessus]
MTRRKDKQHRRLTAVLAAEVWAVLGETPECHDAECNCDIGGDTTPVVKLFTGPDAEALAARWRDHLNDDSWRPVYRTQHMDLFDSIKET